MVEYARSTVVYREIREALGPWCKGEGFRRRKGSEMGWVRDAQPGHELSFWFRCNPWAGAAVGGGSFHGYIQTAPHTVPHDAWEIHQCYVSLCLTQPDLDELWTRQVTINRRRPRTPELEEWMREDSGVGEQTREQYRTTGKPWRVGDFVEFSYFGLDDVRLHTTFLAARLPAIVIRFLEGRCARPNPVPQPEIFRRIDAAHG